MLSNHLVRRNNVDAIILYTQSCCLKQVVVLVGTSEAASLVDIVQLASHVVVIAIECYEQSRYARRKATNSKVCESVLLEHATLKCSNSLLLLAVLAI